MYKRQLKKAQEEAETANQALVDPNPSATDGVDNGGNSTTTNPTSGGKMKKIINILKKVLDNKDVSGGTLIDKKQSIRLQRGGGRRKFNPKNFEDSFKTIASDYKTLLTNFKKTYNQNIESLIEKLKTILTNSSVRTDRENDPEINPVSWSMEVKEGSIEMKKFLEDFIIENSLTNITKYVFLNDEASSAKTEFKRMIISVLSDKVRDDIRNEEVRIWGDDSIPDLSLIHI